MPHCESEKIRFFSFSKNRLQHSAESTHIDLRLSWSRSGCDCSEKRDPAKSDLYARAATARLKWRLSIALGLKDKGADVKREFAAFLISGAVAHWLTLMTVWKACAEALA